MACYNLRPTFDFVQELLKYGAAVKVIKPEWLRHDFSNIAMQMNSLYNNKD